MKQVRKLHLKENLAKDRWRSLAKGWLRFWVRYKISDYHRKERIFRELKNRLFSAARRAAKAETKAEESRSSEEAEAWRSLLPFVRPNNSITGVERDEQGNPVGLDVVIKELPRK